MKRANKAFTAPVAPKKVFGVKGVKRVLKAGGMKEATGPVAPATKQKGIAPHVGHI